MTQLEKQITDMADHIDDLKNRSRRCNLRLVRLPEGMEGRVAVTFMKTWLPSYLNLTTKTGKIKLDHTHHSLVVYHNFADKQRVMAAAQRLAPEPNQPVDWIRVSFFNDYSMAVAKKCKTFDVKAFEVKSCLRRKNMDYALLYPAMLRLSLNGKEKRFNTSSCDLRGIAALNFCDHQTIPFI